MDEAGVAWARAALVEQRAALQMYWDSGGDWRARQARADQMWPRTRDILRELAPDRLRAVTFGAGHWEIPAISAVNFALGVLDHTDEVAQHLGQQGPHLSAVGLHPWVWASAAPLWGVAHQDAVNAAARAVNARMRKKLGSTLGEADLTNDAFSRDVPKPRRSRLRFPGERDDTWTSRMNGARGLGQACFQGVRNVASHTEADWSEQEALEYLAMFSVLARWVEECDVEEVEDVVRTEAAPRP